MVEMKLYEDGIQYNSKADIWETIKTTTSIIIKVYVICFITSDKV